MKSAVNWRRERLASLLLQMGQIIDRSRLSYKVADRIGHRRKLRKRFERIGSKNASRG
jgi:hypothetical protein